MPAGIQVWAADGSMVLDTNDRMTFIIGQFTTSRGSNGSLYFPANGRERWVQVMGVGGYFGSSGAPIASFSGDSLNWTWDWFSASRTYQCPEAFIVYGYY